MKDTEREALGRAIARVIDQRLAEMRERMDAVETQLADVPAAIQRCAPADMVDALRVTVDEFNSRNTEALEAAQGVRQQVEGIAARLDETREAATGMVAEALRKQSELAAAAIDNIKDHALQAWAHVANVRDGEPGPRGKRGEAGPPGTLAQVRTWQPGEIYRAGEYVWLPAGHPRGWAMACAQAETFEIPGDDGAPWEPYVFHGERGEPGDGMRYRGHYAPGIEYARGDVVIGEAGSSWVRTVDTAPEQGPPGDGWGLLAKRGERGTRGKPGEPGKPGKAGADGVGIAELSIEGDALHVLLTNGELRTLPLPMIVIRGTP